MRKTMILLLAIGLVFAMSLPVMATHVQTGIGDPAGGIGNSRHNLGSSGLHIITGSTSEVCVFCHTPHHAAGTGGTGPQPIWNRGQSAVNFTPYVFLRGPDAVAPGEAPSPNFASLACLSCHDGVTTFDNLINAPGKGGYTPGGLDRGWSFTEGGIAEPDYLTSPRLVIGTDLTDDHPISMPYRDSIGYDADADGYGATASLRDRDTLLSAVTSGVNPVPAGPSGTPFANAWSVNGFITEAADINELLKGPDRTVECSSCHDPHYKNMTNAEIDDTYDEDGDGILTGGHPISFDPALWAAETEAVDGLFLRRVGGNSNSGVCRTCHSK